MSINSLETRIQENRKFPVPLKSESYFHHHQPIKFHAIIEGTPLILSAEAGEIFLTDKRLIFIARKPSPIDEFETFHIMLGDITSSILFPSKKDTFSVSVTMRSGIEVIMSFSYEKIHLEDKKIFEAYYGMLIAQENKGDNSSNDDKDPLLQSSAIFEHLILKSNRESVLESDFM
ncbi:13745_t:CDS:1 [Funneliformis geosporum]|uniref:11973_t:CDS:1 n=1 Tax=Funneliformis geosporum TaxID=1117311 RepID=A0A9W4SQS2_9GLOM|nr:13745_t:CDS:1 [Funneliformis geosporum]CAI2177083.1 11973_t:CDS:1 [Funneliformis geosporum]